MQADQTGLFSASAFGGWDFAGIVHWTHRQGRPAHCLARAHRQTATDRPVVVLSEISSNPDGRGLGDDVPAVAEAFLDALPPDVHIDPGDVTWIVHHGEFSYPDALDAPEAFTLVPMEWDGVAFVEDLGRRHRLRGEEIRAALGPMELAPVAEVLNALNHR